MEVKAGAAFPLRFPEKGEHSISSDDQPLSKAARFKHNFQFLRTFLRSMACHHGVVPVNILGLKWASGFLFAAFWAKAIYSRCISVTSWVKPNTAFLRP